MQKIFRKYLFIVMLIVMLAVLVINYALISGRLRNVQKENLETKLDQLIAILDTNNSELEELQDSLEKEYLEKVQQLAYIIEKKPGVLKEQEEVNQLLIMLGADELNVSDENGIIAYSSVPEYVGMNFRIGDQMSEFLMLIDSEDKNAYLIQEGRLNGKAGGQMLYFGVKRRDRNGIIQIGLDSGRLLKEREKNTYTYLFPKMPVGVGEVLFAVDMETGEYLGHTREAKVGTVLPDTSTVKDLLKCEKGCFRKLEHERKYVVTKQYGDKLLCAAVTRDVVYQSRGESLFCMLVSMCLIGGVVVLAMNWLLKNKVVDGVNRILDDVARIRMGDLETVVQVKDNPELTALSEGINGMVESILGATVKLSRIIDLTGMPLAAFECRRDVRKVMATSRVPEILDMDALDAKLLLSDRSLFLERVGEIRKHPVPGERDVYKVGRDKYVKLRLSHDEYGSFGAISDVTDEMQEKLHIRFVHDHDPLTGLNIYQAFKRKAQMKLESAEPQECAACVMIDLDYFKRINDNYGHDFGDSYLIKMAEVMRGVSQDSSIVARRSGDEFCMFLYGYASKDALREAMRLFYKLLKSARVFLPDGNEMTISASSGVAFADGENNLEKLMNKADCALYQVKRGEKGTWQEYAEGCSQDEDGTDKA